MSASTASCNIRFSLRMMMSGADRSISFFNRLLRLITLRYKSFKSLVAKRPPSNCTMGRSSGGNTGNTSITIQVGLLPLRTNESRISKRLIAFTFLGPVDLATTSLSFSYSAFTSIDAKSSFTASAPMPTRKAFSPHFSRASANFASDSICLYSRSVSPGSSTTKCTKYTTCSSALGVMSSNRPIRLGTPRKYQICVTGAANSICPMRSRRTLLRVTSTPHLSQITPL